MTDQVFNQDLEKFREIVFGDEALELQLREINDRDQFVRRVVQLGAERGLYFTEADVEEMMRFYQRTWFERHIA